jgi:hypothetical protein
MIILFVLIFIAMISVMFFLQPSIWIVIFFVVFCFGAVGISLCIISKMCDKREKEIFYQLRERNKK